MLKSFSGRVAVVTGAANGIGLALSRQLAAEGMQVVLVDIDRGALDQAVTSIGGTATAEVVNVADRDAVERLADRTFERFGAVHLLCNNAGLTCKGRIWDFSADDWDRILGVNLRAVINGVGAFLPRMLGEDEGHVVNTGSVASIVTWGEATPYATTKKAVLGLSEGLWHELRAVGSKIGVSVLMPARVDTAIRAHSRASGMPWVVNNEAAGGGIGQAISPEEAAAVVIQAVRTDTFYALTHPTAEWLDTFRAYFDSVLDLAAPSTVRPEIFARSPETA